MFSWVSCREARFASFGERSWHSTSVSLPTKISVSGMEGLCMLLKRLAYPCRFNDIHCSTAIWATRAWNESYDQCRYRVYEHSHHLTDFNQPFLSRTSLRTYADIIHENAAALNNCWGFIDGTVRPICRLFQNQSIEYNGHKRVHALKFQSIATPNGVTANGPVGAWQKMYFEFIVQDWLIKIPEG